MIVRELLTRIGYDVDPKAEKKAVSGFQRVKDAAGKLGIALSVGAVAIGFKKMVDAASDVEETMNVVTTAFEDQADSVLRWAQESGAAAGRSEFAMREYAATVGAVVGPTLGSAEATADLSTSMAQLAVDLGSFFNATDQEALDALRAGLIGSSEPMLRFGVNMNVAALEAFALAQGITKSMKDMTEAEKIQLRYQFIMARTTKAQGDATKTSGGFANQLKRLEGNVRDLAVTIGKQFVGNAANALKVLNQLLVVIKGQLVSVIRLLLAPFKLLGALMIGMWEASIGWKVALGGLILAFVALRAASVKVLIVHGLLALKWLLIGAIIFAVILIIEDLWNALRGGNSVIGGVIDQFWFLHDQSGSVFDAIGEMLRTAVDFWIEYFTGIPEGTKHIGTMLVNAWKDITEKISGFFKSQIDLIVTYWDDAFTRILNAAERFINRFLSPEILKRLEFVGNLIGLGDDEAARAPARIAVPGSPAAGGGNVQSRQTIEVNVNAPGGDGPAIAGAVAPAVGRAAADGNRRTAQQLLAGGATP